MKINWHKIFHEFTENYVFLEEGKWIYGGKYGGKYNPKGQMYFWYRLRYNICTQCGYKKVNEDYIQKVALKENERPEQFTEKELDKKWCW